MYDKKNTIIHINPTGRYVNHSSLHDSGLTGRKLIVDSFGGICTNWWWSTIFKRLYKS